MQPQRLAWIRLIYLAESFWTISMVTTTWMYSPRIGTPQSNQDYFIMTGKVVSWTQRNKLD